MIADSADIRFECEKCGQHLVVEAAAAGLTADCPICNTSVTVPTPGAAGDASGPGATAVQTEIPFADPGPEALRDELIDASMLNGKLLADLERARRESAQFQQQLRELSEEHERLNATATHAQRELKTFQTERQQWKGEAATLRQRVAVAEEAAQQRQSELEKLRAESAALRNELTRASEAIGQGRTQLAAETQLRESVKTRLAEVETRLAQTSQDLDGALGRLAQAETVGQEANANVGRLEEERAQLQSRLEDAGQRLLAAAETAKKLEETEAQLRDTRGTLEKTSDERKHLAEQCQQLQQDLEALRKDLQETKHGREAVETRELLAAATAERERLAGRVSELESGLGEATATLGSLRSELDETRKGRDTAREEAAALRDSQTLRDNEVLRGIVARVNAELTQRTAEVSRLRRAQYGLKIAYAIFGIGLLVVFGFALAVLPRFIH